MDASHYQAREILEAAFDDAFAAPEREPVSQTDDAPVVPQPIASQTTSRTGAEPLLEGTISDDDESWKVEYDGHLRVWRAQSAEQREKAGKERLRWETVRAHEKEEAEHKKLAGGENWEKLGASGSTVASTAASSQLMDDRHKAELSHGGTSDDIHKWENVPSIDSSFPSILPDTAPTQPTGSLQEAPASVTLSVFDSSLSTRTRMLALASSLAMNLVLPFINGVMLGFGEIFARHVITDVFGWRIAAMNVGLRNNRGR